MKSFFVSSLYSCNCSYHTEEDKRANKNERCRAKKLENNHMYMEGNPDRAIKRTMDEMKMFTLYYGG